MPWGAAVIAVTYGLARYGFGLHLPRFRAEFGLSSAAAGGIAAGGYLAYCLAALLGRRWAARGRARSALWLAAGTAAAGSLLVAAAWSAPALTAGVLVAGTGAGAATPALVAAVAATVPPAAGPRAQAVVNSGTGAGVVVGGLLVLAVPEAWRAAWAGFAMAAVLATWGADRSTRWAAAGDGGRRSRLRVRELARPLVAATVAGAGCAGVWTFGRDLLADPGGLADGTTGLLWCVLGAAGLLGGISGDLVQRVGLRAAWAGAAAGTAVATVLLAVLPGVPWAAGVALAVFGCGFVVLSGVLIAWGAQVVPAAAAQAAAVLFTGLTVGQAAGSLVLGLVAGGAGARTAFVVAAGLLLAAATVTERAAGSVSRPAAAAGRPR
ncbi:MFS transporter [Modestobacter sp. SSW1-42]|uniref:MFS transporter n=1 Tax=Modestobacter sp. SSW1-42 TaxID=596372 RepID=UPI0039874E62